MTDYVSIGTKTYEDGFSYQDFNEIQQNIVHFRQMQNGVRVSHSTNQTLTSGSLTTLSFNTETYDPTGMHDNVTNNSRLTAQQPGFYQIWGHITWGTSSVGRRQLVIRKDGTTVIADTMIDQPIISECSQSIWCDFRLDLNDYVELRALQVSGGNLDVVSASAYSPIFGARWMSGDDF